MKTRGQIYGNEASSLLRDIAMYRTLTEEQICRLYPGKGAVVKNLLVHLARQGRVYRNPGNGRVSATAECDAQADSGLLAAVWVLIDFIEKAECHYAGDFPVKVGFFSEGEMYEIVHVPYGREALMNHALADKNGDMARRIVLVDQPGQIGAISIPNTAGYCSVEPGGAVRYYKLSESQ